VKPNGFTHETVNRVIPKTPPKNNGSSEGAGGGQNGPGGTPQETAKDPQETAQNQASTVSPMKPSGGDTGFMGETLLYFHSGSGAKPEPAQPPEGAPLKLWRSVRFGDLAKAERTRRSS
jgi:hypothetical protein